MPDLSELWKCFRNSLWPLLSRGVHSRMEFEEKVMRTLQTNFAQEFAQNVLHPLSKEVPRKIVETNRRIIQKEIGELGGYL